MIWLDGSEVDQFGQNSSVEIRKPSLKQKSRKGQDDLPSATSNTFSIPRTDRHPTDTWSLLVGILGLPREINPPPTTTRSLATWSLIIIILLITLTSHVYPQAREYLEPTANSPWGQHFVAWTMGLFRFPDLISLLVNIYFLSLFGDNVEDAVGPWKFLSLFLCASVLVTVTGVLGNETIYSSLGGSQGGIAAMIGFYATRWPKERLAVWPLAWLGPLGWVYVLTSLKQGRSRSGSISSRPFMRQWRLPVWGWFAIWVTCLVVGTIWLGGHRPTLVGYQVLGAALGYVAAKAPLDRLFSSQK
jgi:membrane associated rhomboid family serine protease